MPGDPLHFEFERVVPEILMIEVSLPSVASVFSSVGHISETVDRRKIPYFRNHRRK